MYKVIVSKLSSNKEFIYEFIDYAKALDIFISSCIRAAEMSAICDGSSSKITLIGQYNQEMKSLSVSSIKEKALTF